MAKILTINELYAELGKYKKAGKGNKKVLISNDDEGNGFHYCFFAVTEITDDFSYADMPFSLPLEKAKEEFVILG